MEADVCLINHVPSTVSSSLHHNGNVQIREYDDSLVNPDPVIRNEDTEQLMQDYLSPQKLKCLTGIEDLSEVLFLEMIVNTTQNSLGNFGSMVQNLKQLKLSNSIIVSVRDLGTSLANLQTLWMAKCGVAELDGISSLCSIKELYLAYNDITDVSPLSMLDSLEVLDLEGNRVEDMAQVEFLVLCPELKRLTLEGNPVCMKPRPDCSPETILDYNYRAEVHKALPKLAYLDDEPFLFDLVNGTRVLKITPFQQKNVNLREKLKSDWELVTERIKAFDLEEESAESSKEVTGRPRTSQGNRPTSASRERPTSARRRPGSARSRPGTARPRPGTARPRPGTASTDRTGSGAVARPMTAVSERDLHEDEDDSSDLTHGSSAVICGNPSRALRARRKNMIAKEENVLQVDLVSSNTDEDLSQDKELSQRDLFEELKAWRREYARFLDNRTENIILEDAEDAAKDEGESECHTLSTESPSSLSPTPPQRPTSSSPPSSASSRLRVTRIRKSLPVPSPPGQATRRPRTAAEFRHHVTYRHKSSEARLGPAIDGSPSSNRQETSRDIEVNSTESRANSAPTTSNSSKSQLLALKDKKIIDTNNPVISASKELQKPRVDPRLLRRIRPASARPASQRSNKLP